MTEQLPFVDPGYGSGKAAPGTVGWAQNLRLTMQGLVKDLEKTPQDFADYIDMCVKSRTWTLLNYPEGGPDKPRSKEKFFASFQEYCAYPEPWGLGTPWEQIRPHVESLLSPQAFALLIAKPDQRVNNGANVVARARDEKGRLLPGQSTAHNPDSHHCGENLGESKRKDGTEQRLSSILRAPQPVQQLYRQGLIGQVVAAKLGPDRPTPEQAAKIAEVTEAIRDTPAPKTEREKAKVQRQVNTKVREMLGATPDPMEAARKAVMKLKGQDLVDLIVSVVERLDAQTFERLWGRLAKLDRRTQ